MMPRRSIAAAATALLLCPIATRAQSGRGYAGIAVEADYFNPGFTTARGWTPNVGATLGIDLTRRISVEAGIARPWSTLAGSSQFVGYPFGQREMTREEILASGAVTFERRTWREVTSEIAVLGRVTLGALGRLQPAAVIGVMTQRLSERGTTQRAIGTRERFDLMTEESARRTAVDTFLAFGFETAVDISARLTLVPHLRVDVLPYGDAPADYLLRTGIGVRWRF